ncbi:MAG: UDP-glucose 4-epimerase [Planctomycetes bacterium ADurb.Bin126]|nr:MAG: UDP-glucose 4-epimerase [Planctomycetes bacterium ADurb.Bin126]HOD80982.1 NAD(P)-dependent oxidoreductase [Phycisphaerae bacterium]HQL73337.1 NAD(P)-dependent oxidoreductase [Phycisphaerae bacterium]
MNVLVVGGAGYVGGAVTDMLEAGGQHAVRVFDALLYEESYRKQVDFVYGDIRDTGRLTPHLEWSDAVIWLAALVGDGACALHPEVSVAINQECVRWLAEHYDKRIVFMSTCSVYGAQEAVLDESAPADPLSVYATTKLAAEKYLADRNAIVFRLGTLFGVGDLFARIRMDLVVNTLTVRAHQKHKINVFGGDQFRPLLHVRDAARAAVENLQTSHTGVFNLQRQNVRIMDLAYQVRNHFPDLVIEHTPMKFQDARNYRVSSEKARTVLGFKPQGSIDEGIEEVKFLLESRRLKNVDNPRYTNQVYLSMFNTHLDDVGERHDQ